MIGTKIRSWMEAHIVRPRKKQHRKDITAKKHFENNKDAIEPIHTLRTEAHTSTIERTTATATLTPDSTTMVNDRTTKAFVTSEQTRTQFQRHQNSTNLSSPESAYSTGYSTDGTSPGASFPAATPAPEYYINIRTGTRYFHSSPTDVPLKLLMPGLTTSKKQAVNPVGSISAASNTEQQPTIGGRIVSPALTSSPRQRTRIRTNPWVTTTNNSGCNCSPMHVVAPRQPAATLLQSTVSNKPPLQAATASPVRRKWTCVDKKQRCMKCGACSRFEAFSSSSSSSLSVSSVHRAAARPSVASEDEDDRTLNEMMGKYDESYVYEKETDILSDSDPTDCDEEYDDTDVDAGREGGDERDPLTDEDDFDFIDNGSLELNMTDDGSSSLVNMGHCTYHNFHDEQQPRRRESSNKAPSYRKSTGGTPTTVRRRRTSERRSKHASSKKRRERHPVGSPFKKPVNAPVILTPILARARVPPGFLAGSRSAGATPVSVRRRKAAMSEQSWASKSVDKPRRNSVSHTRRNPHVPPDARLYEGDKEADKKYRELIIEAEHILMAMSTNSPPVIGSPARRNTVGPANKRVELLRFEECGNVVVGGGSNNNTNSVDVLKPTQVSCVDVGAVKFSPKKNHITNFINNNAPGTVPLSGGSRGKLPVAQTSSSPRRAPLLAFKPTHPDLNRHCPQSEPVKRKVYATVNDLRPAAAARLLFTEMAQRDAISDGTRTSTAVGTGSTVFQRQKLFHTITHLKKNLEIQSETLRHAYYYGSNQRLSLGTTQHL